MKRREAFPEPPYAVELLRECVPGPVVAVSDAMQALKIPGPKHVALERRWSIGLRNIAS